MQATGQGSAGMNCLITAKLRHTVATNAGFENFMGLYVPALAVLIILRKIAMPFMPYEPNCTYTYSEQAEKRREALNLPVLKPWDMDVDISGQTSPKTI